MNAFEKIIKRLEKETDCPNCSMYCADADMCGFDEMRKQAIEIVNQVAEEYGDGADSNDLMVVESLPSLYPLQDFEEEAVRRVVTSRKQYGEEVCEWFDYDYRTIAPKSHDVENPYWRIPKDMSKIRFCPYCGKKIKVVEPHKASKVSDDILKEIKRINRMTRERMSAPFKAESEG